MDDSARLSTLRNGSLPHSPIELIVFGLERTSGNKLDAVRGALARSHSENKQGPGWVKLSVGEGYDEGTVRISWDEQTRPGDIDITESLDGIRTTLLFAGFKVYWSCSPSRDRRREGSFTLIPMMALTSPAVHAVRAVIDYCIGHGQRLVRHKAETIYDGITVHMTLNDLDSITTLQGEMATSASGNFFEAYSFQASFEPSAVIPVPYPSTVATPNRTILTNAALLQELNGWVDKFNKAHGANERLRDISKGRQIQRVHEYIVAVPSSVGLAEFIEQQTPVAGLPYELAFRLNEAKLVPRAVRTAVRQMGRVAYDSAMQSLEAGAETDEGANELLDDTDREILETATKLMVLEKEAKKLREVRKVVSSLAMTVDPSAAPKMLTRAEEADGSRSRVIIDMAEQQSHLNALLQHTSLSGSGDVADSVADSAAAALSIDLSTL